MNQLYPLEKTNKEENHAICTYLTKRKPNNIVAANPSQSARVSASTSAPPRQKRNPSEGYEETLANLRPSSFLLHWTAATVALH
jgi:hypothetical protein